MGRGKRQENLRLVPPTPTMHSPGRPYRGSLLPLEMFAAWCRSYAAFALARGYGPGMVFGDAPDFPEPYGETWELEPDAEAYADVEDQVDEVIREWLEDHSASQIGVCAPVGCADNPFLLLVVCDEADVSAAIAPVVAIDGVVFLGDWMERATDRLPAREWQELLAKNLNSGRTSVTEGRAHLPLAESGGELRPAG